MHGLLSDSARFLVNVTGNHAHGSLVMFQVEIEDRVRRFPSRAKALEWFRVFGWDNGRLIHPDGWIEPISIFSDSEESGD